jgi:hypothetical protein
MMVKKSFSLFVSFDRFVFLFKASDTFAGSDLHYKIPFWIGVIVISLLFLSAIIASIRYCFYTLCSSHTGKLYTFHTFFILIG